MQMAFAPNKKDIEICFLKKNTFVSLSASGSKHSFIYTFLLSIFLNKKVIINNVPEISDVIFLLDYAVLAGAKIEYNKMEKMITINEGIKKNMISTPFVVNCRSALLAVTLHLLRFGYVKVPNLLGGCKIGNRQIDQHVELWKKMGGSVKIDDFIEISFLADTTFIEEFSFDFDTTMGTVAGIFCMYEGKIGMINNISVRPEVQYLIEFINTIKEKYICKINDNSITVKDGKKVDNLSIIEYRIPSDIDEVLGYACLMDALGVNGEIIADIPYIKSMQFIETLSNGRIKWLKNAVWIKSDGNCSVVRKDECAIEASFYPNISSDLQPILVVWASKYCNKVTVIDRKFIGRVEYLNQLSKLGWYFIENNGIYSVEYCDEYIASVGMVEIVATDLRCAFAELIAIAITKSSCVICHAEQLHRGYSNIIFNLTKLGAVIKEKKQNIHESVAVILVDSLNRLILQQRDLKDIKNSGKVSFWGGAMFQGETPISAAKREILEEIGLELDLIYLNQIYINEDAYSMTGYVYLFFCKVLNELDVVCNEGRVIKCNVDDVLNFELSLFCRAVMERRGDFNELEKL
ncbi:MAG: NUDIX domain-containing protein [Bacillota bacterium]